MKKVPLITMNQLFDFVDESVDAIENKVPHIHEHIADVSDKFDNVAISLGVDDMKIVDFIHHLRFECDDTMLEENECIIDILNYEILYNFDVDVVN